ncbi:HECT-type E3 ubiquitin transferase [Ranunculus cassubicifolius]
MSRNSPKRKLDDLEDLVTAVTTTTTTVRVPSSSSSPLQFFVRMMSGGNTIVIHANPDDYVESIHEQICTKTGLPIHEQRLIFQGKQLDISHTLRQCCIRNDSNLQLVGRMRSINSQDWGDVNGLVECVYQSICKGEFQRSPLGSIINFLEFNCDDAEKVFRRFQLFKSLGAPRALVMLYVSPLRGNKDKAEECIKLFLPPKVSSLSTHIQLHCSSVLLEFCKLLKANNCVDSLYNACRATLGYLLTITGPVHGTWYFDYAKESAIIQELFPFVREIADSMVAGLVSLWNSSTFTGTALANNVCEFTTFVHPLLSAIEDHIGTHKQSEYPIELHKKHPCYMEEIQSLYNILLELLYKIKQCLLKVEGIINRKGPAGERESLRYGWHQYIPILKQLHNICKLFKGAKDVLISTMRSMRIPLNVLIRQLKRSVQSDEYCWLLDLNDVTDSESTRHLLMMMFPETVDEYEEMHEMLIDRSHLLEESFEYIAHADRKSFRGRLFMEFKNEEATGPGVVREWFYLVCQAIFNPQIPLFLACPNDHRRFFPNPASKVDSLHLEYFGFCGRIIALALMNKVHVGIAFDRIFLLQLAGKSICLEDIRDADPCLYMSCKKILEMDSDFLDSDALGLTFVWENEELGSRRAIQLCDGGKDIIVNSKNRVEYVNLVIKYRFVTSISRQVAYFSQGFGDILSNQNLVKLFFGKLEPEDFNQMLRGSNDGICVKEWAAHTNYNGYKRTDRQICWFWKVVEDMSREQQRLLLYFWTAVKYLPLEGFGGLESRLYIYRASSSSSSGSHGRLPSSHTCFYRLCLPPYRTKAAMHNSLHLITQEHFSSSFGTG